MTINHKHKNFPGLHREGTTVNSLFGLYFWDALYSPVSDVFRSPHQASPLDLDDPNFYAARKKWIDQRQVFFVSSFFFMLLPALFMNGNLSYVNCTCHKSFLQFVSLKLHHH